MLRPHAVSVALLACLALAGGCAGGPVSDSGGGTASPRPSATHPPTRSPSQHPTSGTPSPTPSPTRPPGAAPGTVPPAWFGKRVLPRRPDGFGVMGPTPPELRNRRFTLPDRLPMLPGDGFAWQATTPAPDAVIARSTWAPGCPVGREDLSWLRLAFVGFDGRRHTGELLVNKAAVRPLARVFHDLYDARFPLEEMRITTKAEQTAPPTGDGNDTGAFNCRAVRGASTYSQHAYGLAVDVNPFQNPYTKGNIVLPELARAYLDRSRSAPGMIHPGGVVVRAFARVGWGWGGSWHGLKDLQHFSANGR